MARYQSEDDHVLMPMDQLEDQHHQMNMSLVV